MQLEIDKVLTLATNHVTVSAKYWLESRGQENARAAISGHMPSDSAVMTSGYGWMVHIPENLEEDFSYAPASLQSVAKFALDHGCRWVHLDCDADPVDELPLYEW